MKTLWLVLIMSAALTARATDSPVKEEMRFKLFYSQGILEGIVTENFSLIASNATKMRQFAQQPGWDVQQTSEYRRLKADFEQAVNRLLGAAKQNNVDSATVYYFQLTTTCVTCHKHLRGAQLSSISPPPGQQLASLNSILKQPVTPEQKTRTNEQPR